jgi:hypothetical protein
MHEAGGYRTDLVRFSDIELFVRMQKYGETGYTGHEARVYTSARREEHQGIAGLITGSIQRRIRTRMQTLGIVDDPLKALVAKEQSFQEGRYPPIR